jgi:hypothetical protein
MFLKSLLAVTLFTSFLGAAGPGDSDIFDVRSFFPGQTKKKLPVTGQLFGNDAPKILAAEVMAKNDKCAIPLTELRAANTGDKIAKPVGPVKVDPSSIMAPPMPVCEGWNQGQTRSTPILRLH